MSLFQVEHLDPCQENEFDDTQNCRVSEISLECLEKKVIKVNKACYNPRVLANWLATNNVDPKNRDRSFTRNEVGSVFAALGEEVPPHIFGDRNLREELDDTVQADDVDEFVSTPEFMRYNDDCFFLIGYYNAINICRRVINELPANRRSEAAGPMLLHNLSRFLPHQFEVSIHVAEFIPMNVKEGLIKEALGNAASEDGLVLLTTNEQGMRTVANYLVQMSRSIEMWERIRSEIPDNHEGQTPLMELLDTTISQLREPAPRRRRR